MKRKINKIVSAIIIMLLLLFFKTEVKAAENNEKTNTNNNLPTIRLQTDVTEIKKDQKIPIEIFVTDGDQKVSGLDVLIDYNKDLFYDLTEDDFKTDLKTETFSYEANSDPTGKYGNFIILLSEGKEIKNEIIATIYLTPKVDIPTNGQKVQMLRIFDGLITYEDSSNADFLGQDISGWPSAEELEKLYLNTDIYKIGNNNINQYEEDDRFISQVEPQTTLKTFISNLTTNGTTIKVLKPDGTELEDADDQYVGTGMTLLITKDEDTKMPQKIKLQISVKGDIARSAKEGEEDGANLKWGDGQVTMIDLTRANLAFLDMLDLEDEFKISADINESNRISIIDIVNINLMFLGLQQ